MLKKRRSELKKLPDEIKAIVFDLGEVLAKHRKGLTEIEGRGYIVPNPGGIDWTKPKAFNILKASVFGRINERQFYRALLPLMKQKISFSCFKKEWNDGMIWKPHVANYLKSLNRAGYKIGIISDCDSIFFNEVLRRFGLKPFIDGRALSYEVHSKKPSSKMWNNVLRELNLKASECVYIDDLQKYVVKARELGWNAFRFQNLTKLKQDLARIGVKAKKVN